MTAIMTTESSGPLVTECAEGLLGRTATAVFSGDHAYRYLLTRAWDERVPMTWIMLNPSTASAVEDDATIVRCTRFARREDYGGIRVVNLFALRSTDPRALKEHEDPVGPSNDHFIDEAAGAGPVVAAWGAFGYLRERSREVSQRLTAAGVSLLCLGVTGTGHPRHPLYVRADAPLVPFGGAS